jgi:hypothetical protein
MRHGDFRFETGGRQAPLRLARRWCALDAGDFTFQWPDCPDPDFSHCASF